MENVNKIIFGIAALIVTVIIILVIISNLSSIDTTRDYVSDKLNDLYISPVNLTIGDNLVSSSVTIYNQTWLDFDGVNDRVSLDISQSKTTISFWFKNNSVDWISIIKSGENIYVNNTLDNAWTYLPYYIDGDTIYIGKTDATTFVNCSIDEFRVYEQAINVSDVGIIYGEGR